MRNSTTHVFLLGCRASGKTSFLTGLAVLSRGGSDSRFQLVTEDGPTTRMITDLRVLAEQQQWPPPTSSMVPLTFELAYCSPYGERQFQIALLDYPGEDLLETMETLNFEERRPLEEQFQHADYILVVADPTQDLITPLTTDLVEARRRQDALVQAVGQLGRHRRQPGASRRSQPEIAILISKRDMLDEKAISTATIVQENNSFIKNLTRFSSSRPQCFPVTACGQTATDADGRSLPPATPRPAGYEPLFNWLSQRHFWAKNRRWIFLGIAAVLLAGLLVGGYHLWSRQQEETLIRTIENGSISEVITAVGEVRTLKVKPADALDRRVEAELARIEKELEGGPTVSRLKDLASQLKQLAGLPPTAHARKLDETVKRIDGAREEALFNAIIAEQRTGNTALLLELIAEYKAEFPTGNHRHQVDHIYERTVGEQRAAARGRIRAIPITNRESLASKAKEIRNYLKSYADDPHAADMGKAASLAEGLAASDALRLRIKGCGFSNAKDKRHHEIRLFVNREHRATIESAAKGTASTFDQVVFLQSSEWTAIAVELWDLRFGNEKIAHSDLVILRDLSGFDGKNHFALTDTGGDWSGAEAYIIIEIQWGKDQGWSAIPGDELQAYGRFIAPGRDW